MIKFFIKLVCFFTSVALTACGGGGSDPVAMSTPSVTNTTTVPALGAVYGASVTVYDAKGLMLGSGTTDKVTGKATLTLTANSTGPFIYKVELAPGSRYYDEGLEGVLTTQPGQSLTMLSVVSSLNAEVGVTALSNLAVRLAGIHPENLGQGVAPDFSMDKLNMAQATVISVLGLPSDFDLFAAPIAASQTNKNPASAYGKLLVQMAKHTEPDTNAFEQAASLATAITEQGVVNAKALQDLNQAFLGSAASMGLIISDAKALINDPAMLAQRVNAVKKAIETRTKPLTAAVAPTPKAGGSASMSGQGTATLN